MVLAGDRLTGKRGGAVRVERPLAVLGLGLLIACSSSSPAPAAASSTPSADGGSAEPVATGGPAPGVPSDSGSPADAAPDASVGITTSVDATKPINSLSSADVAQYGADVTAYLRARFSVDETRRVYAAFEGLAAAKGTTNDALRTSCQAGVEQALGKTVTQAPLPAWVAPDICYWTLAKINACVEAEVAYAKALAADDVCSQIDVVKRVGEVSLPECAQPNCDVDQSQHGHGAIGEGVPGTAVKLFPWNVDDLFALGLGPL
jgi:hypothetical protein